VFPCRVYRELVSKDGGETKKNKKENELMISTDTARAR
jgi:hypothetical protein